MSLRRLDCPDDLVPQPSHQGTKPSRQGAKPSEATHHLAPDVEDVEDDEGHDAGGNPDQDKGGDGILREC